MIFAIGHKPIMEEKDKNNLLEEVVQEPEPAARPEVSGAELKEAVPAPEAAEEQKENKAEALEVLESSGSEKEKPAPVVAEGVAPATPAGAKTAQVFSAEQETRLNEAVTLAFSEGIEKAIELIKKDDSAYLVDALHDKLVDELYQRLIQAGKLKEL